MSARTQSLLQHLGLRVADLLVVAAAILIALPFLVIAAVPLPAGPVSPDGRGKTGTGSFRSCETCLSPILLCPAAALERRRNRVSSPQEPKRTRRSVPCVASP